MSEKKAATHELIERATPDFDFFFMVALAVIMACIGLMQGSETVVIGSMLIAPMLYPVLSVSLGLATGDLGILRRSLATITKATLLSIGVGLVAGLFGVTQPVAHLLTPEIIFRTEPTLFSLGVAVVSGLAVAYALMRPRLSETLAGIAISVSLIPPLAVVGLGLAWFNLSVAISAFAVFLLNIAGIIAAALIIFALTDLKGMDREAEEAVKDEEERIRKETAKLEKLEKIEKEIKAG